ncbi:P-loop containing nucleoside triphosphate hydrolase protein [Dipodascopsis tothii]|uniref:P-loop containing nucleoside triphosphate hydrolase protein n=1 Tax=Dipodascopsis tothii TaxID=44089 RepID=UPI0034CF561E
MDEIEREQMRKYGSILTKYKAVEAPADGAAAAHKPVAAARAAGLVPIPQPEAHARSGDSGRAEWFVRPTYVRPDQTRPFAKLGLSERMVRTLADSGFADAFSVQMTMIPELLRGIRELAPDAKPSYLVNAATGSGKTLAYGVPIVEALQGRVVPQVRALIILPTKPLVQQVRAVVESLARGTSLRVVALRSDRPFREEQALLRAHTPDILLATPGRLVDHIRQSGLVLGQLRFLVIDEADRLLNQSFQEWVDVLMGAIDEDARLRAPLTEAWAAPVQKLIFSATLSRDAGKWASLRIKLPRVYIVGERAGRAAADVTDDFAVPATLAEHTVAVPDPALKPLVLLNLLRQEGVRDHALVFAKSNEAAARLAALLTILDGSLKRPATPYRIGVVTGELDLAQRRRTLASLADGALDLVVCTDFIARGIDISHIKHVVNYDLPLSAREYVHRVGRTARAGNDGAAWTLVANFEKRWYKGLLRQIKRARDQRVASRDVTIWDGDEAVYQRSLAALEKTVKGQPAKAKK